MAQEYGQLVSEVGKMFRRFEKVYWAAKRDAQEARAMRAAWLKESSEETK